MRKILLLFLTALLFGSTVSLASCTANDDNTIVVSQPTIARIQERGTILIGTTGDYRPLSFREADGTYWGFGIEVAGVIAERLGVGIEFVQTSWPTLSADVQAEPQTFDLAIGGITITDARRETMLMSDGYLANGKTILCRTTEADRYKSLADIDKPEVRVMVNPGGLNEKFANANLTHATIIVHQKNEEIPSMIAENEADIMITEITEAPYYIKEDTRLAAPYSRRDRCADAQGAGRPATTGERRDKPDEIGRHTSPAAPEIRTGVRILVLRHKTMYTA